MARKSLRTDNIKKNMYGPIDFNKFGDNIMRKRKIVVLLDRERKYIEENYRQTVALKERSLYHLKFYAEKYHETILKSIVRIQKWYRAHKTREFFKTLLRKERDRVR